MNLPRLLLRAAPRLVLFSVVAVASSGCAHMTRIEKVCGSAPNDRVCLGEMVVPRAKAADFESGAKEAIDALHSSEFKTELDSFIRGHGTSGDLEPAWRSHDAETIVAALRREIVGTQVSTFGGPKGLWFYVVYDTVAFERAADDAPVRMNRWGLGSRTSADIANTIVHEVAHAAGLTHPHMGGEGPNDASISACEPPYFLGSLAQKVAKKDQWKLTRYDCSLLGQGRRSGALPLTNPYLNRERRADGPLFPRLAVTATDE